MTPELAERLEALEGVLRKARATSDRAAAGRLLSGAQKLAREIIASHGGEVSVPATLEGLYRGSSKPGGFWRGQAR